MKFTALSFLVLGATTSVQAVPDEAPAIRDQTVDIIELSDIPETCGFVYGDPHVFSWDGQNVDCRMPNGDFLYAKSKDSDFEIQVRHVPAPEDASEKNKQEKGWYIGTGTQAIVINTGHADEPVLEIDAYTEGAKTVGQCSIKYLFDGEKVELGANAQIENVKFERRAAWQKDIWSWNWYQYHFRNFYFEKSGVFIQVTKHYWDMYGCYMDVRICIPDEIKSQNLYGLLGNANGDKSDDMMDKQGNVVSLQRSEYSQWDKKDDYCNDNWCILNQESSMFKNPNIFESTCKTGFDLFEEAVLNASEEIKSQCNYVRSCIEDALQFRSLQTAQMNMLIQNVIESPEVTIEDEVEEDICHTPEGEVVDCDPVDISFKCEAVGFDFGFEMDGCQPTPAETFLDFHDLILTDQTETCNADGYDVGSYAMSCSSDAKEVTITPSVNAVVKVSGATHGLEYSGLEAAKTYTLTTGNGPNKEPIQKIEFCFKCPTSIENGEIVECDADVFTCPGGIAVPRDPANDCEFHECPNISLNLGGSANFLANDEAQKASGSGDPHFKTWTGEKFDYHGQCDLVLIDNPFFNDGQGLRVHIRTTRVKYFSFIEQVAIQIGDEVLEFDNDVENFLLNGEPVEENRVHHKTMLGGFWVRRDKKALSIRIRDDRTAEARQNGEIAKIDLHTRKNGFPAVIVDAGKTDAFKGSLGMLGEWGTGRKLGRDGVTEFEVDPKNAEEFALEWQVRDTDPVLFKDTTRFPQYPMKCIPPEAMPQVRLGMAKRLQEAEEACSHWAEDKEDCIFDVLATQDASIAEEGHIIHIE